MASVNGQGLNSENPELELIPAMDDDGPRFDFLNPDVIKAGKAVEAAAQSLGKELAVLKGKADLELHGWDSVYSELLKLLTGSLATLYGHYDSYVNAVLATGEAPIQCRPACPSCCSHYPTSIEPFELLGLHAVLRSRDNYPELMFSLHERTQVFRKGFKGEEGEDAEDKALYRYFLRNKPCPLLTPEGSCGARENRPMSCRMYFSLSAPSRCKGKAIASVGNQNFIVALPDEAEIALAEASEFLNDLELSQHFYDGLLQINERFGKLDGL